MGCLAGCHQRPPALAPVPLGNSGLTVSLSRPDAKRHYGYSVSDASGVTIRRFLGPAHVEAGRPPTVAAENGGRSMVRWGTKGG